MAYTLFYFILGGENISSIEVEAILLTNNLIDEAAVIAYPDEKWGEVPYAFVTLRNKSTINNGKFLYMIFDVFDGQI